MAAAYRVLLQRRTDLRVTGMSRDPEACVRVVPEEGADLVLVDQREPEHAGLDWIADLKRAAPAVRVLMLRESVSPDLAARALNGGVDALLVRTQSPHELFLALDALRRGRAFLTHRLALPGWGPDRIASPADPERLAAVRELDEVERRAFLELALGRDLADVARALGVDEARAAELERALRERLDCPGRADLTRLAIDARVLPIERGGGGDDVARTA